MTPSEQAAFDKIRDALERIATSYPPAANESAHLKNIAYNALSAAKAVNHSEQQRDMVQTQREAFEAWVKREYKSLAYLHLSVTSGKWDTWKAAQAAQPSQIPESAILHRMKYHAFPATGDEPADYELFEPNIECKDCIDVLIVRAAPTQEPGK